MVIDLAKCIGCDACSVACKVENKSPGRIWYAPVHQIEVGKFPKARRIFIPTLCMHCEDPPCMKACPSKAIYKRPDGIVMVDEEKCCGARACVTACPYGAMHFFDEDDKTINPKGPPTEFDLMAGEKFKLNTAQKCTFCSHRIDYGLKNGLKPGIDLAVTPACVITCPTECRVFGDLSDPESKPSRLLRERRSITLRPEAGTKPNVVYLL